MLNLISRFLPLQKLGEGAVECSQEKPKTSPEKCALSNFLDELHHRWLPRADIHAIEVLHACLSRATADSIPITTKSE